MHITINKEKFNLRYVGTKLKNGNGCARTN